MFNPRLTETLTDFPFARLNALIAPITPPAHLSMINMSVGEPQGAMPAFARQIVIDEVDGWNRYPPNQGLPDLNLAICEWLTRRYKLPQGLLDPNVHVHPTAGSKEGVYIISTVATPQEKGGGKPIVALPNPFYQAYLGGAVLSGGEPLLVNAEASNGFLPDYESLDEATWQRLSVVYLCSPANPQGAIASKEYLQKLLRLCRKYDTVLAVDECYAEIYTGEPPTGALQAWATARDDRGALPLTGTVVLDLTAFWAGPSATRNLADLGATVIKVERPGSRVDLDNQLADPAALVPHLFHCKMNRHKLSITLDLASPEGRDAALRLAGQADVLVENFRPGVTDRLGLGAAQLCAANPSLVYVSLSGYGAAGPWGDLRSYGPNIEAVSSIEARTGYAGGEPLRLGHTLPDGVGGLVGTLAVLRGLREREARGGGWFEISQLEAYVALSGEEILTASKAGRAPPRIGNRSRTGAIQGAFPCRGDDQWVAVRIAGQADAERFATVSGEPEVSRAAAANPRDLDRIEALIAGFTRTLDKHDAARRLQAAGLEAAPIFTPEDLLADPHLRERGFFVTVRADGWEIDLPGSPFHGDRALADPHGVAPRFGADTAEILRLGRNSR